MIKEIQSKTDCSICDYLVRMGQRTRTYSGHYIGLEPFGDNSHIYIYGTRKEMVVVYVDRVEQDRDEVASEEHFGTPEKNPVYLSLSGERTSPVFLLDSFIRSLKSHLDDFWSNTISRFWGVVVTNSHIMNQSTMKSEWESMGISVYDMQDRMDTLTNLPVNSDDNMWAADYLTKYLSYRANESDIDDAKFNEFLKKFLEEDFDIVDDGKEKKETEYAMDDEQEDTLPFPTMEDDSDLTLDDDDDFDDDDQQLMSTTGEVELNPNNVIKVEILQPINNPKKELDKLVGCKKIKKRIDELITMNHYNDRLHKLNPMGKTHDLSLHSIFLGRPGTGKTTVCKIMGSLLKKAGMLSRGHVVVCNRSTFIGSNWGDEERAVRQVLEMAKGGVLMIDEAYLLNSEHKSDPGKMVIPMLMDILANEHQRDLAIVLCGYKQPMLRLLELNPGLDSRFPNRFEFEDFSIDELLDITKMRIHEYDYTFTPSAWDSYRTLITSAYNERDPQTWGNARFVANQLERIYLCHAQRCMKEDVNDRESFLSIIPEDIQAIEVPKPKPRIGF